MQTYEAQLNQSLEWALKEGSMHFEEKNAVHTTLKKLTRRLNDLEIDYAVAGGMALFRHGYRRFTEDVDILVTREGLTQIHKELTGLGYLPPFSGSKNLRDVESGVRIEFLVSGDFPGDGQPKPVSFPDPAEVTDAIDDVRYLNLATLIELKLASGMTNPRRMQDLVDVQELIANLSLTIDFVEKLNPYVAEKYKELWQIVQSHPDQL